MSTEDLALAAVLLVGAEPARGGSPWHRADGFRLGVPRPRTLVLEHDGGTATVELLPTATGWQATVGDTGVVVEVDARGATIDGLRRPRTHAVDGDTVWLGDAGWSTRLRRLSRRDLLEADLARISREEGAADPLVRSPMPGTVVSVAVEDGAAVSDGDVLLTVEAMKMEHRLTAAVSGIVHLSLRPGDLVRAQQVVASIDSPDTATPGTATPDSPADPGDEPSEGDPA